MKKKPSLKNLSNAFMAFQDHLMNTNDAKLTASEIKSL